MDPYLVSVTVTYGKVVACLSSLVGSGRGRGIDHYSGLTRERGQVMDKEILIEALEIAISNFDYDNEWDKADEVRDYLDNIKKEGESDDVESISWSSSNPTGERASNE